MNSFSVFTVSFVCVCHFFSVFLRCQWALQALACLHWLFVNKFNSITFCTCWKTTSYHWTTAACILQVLVKEKVITQTKGPGCIIWLNLKLYQLFIGKAKVALPLQLDHLKCKDVLSHPFLQQREQHQCCQKLRGWVHTWNLQVESNSIPEKFHLKIFGLFCHLKKSRRISECQLKLYGKHTKL